MDFQTDTNKMMARFRVNEQTQTALKIEAYKQIKFEYFHFRFCDEAFKFMICHHEVFDQSYADGYKLTIGHSILRVFLTGSSHRQFYNSKAKHSSV